MKTVTNDMKKIVRSMKFALKGLLHAYRGDKSFRMEVNYGLPIYLGLAWLLAPLQPWEIILYTFSYLLILIVELINTAFEKMLERVHPDEHELIGRSKDISSAAVFVALVFAVVVVCVLAWSRCHMASGFSVSGVMV
jgi:diacylglycerol kinase